MDGRILANYFPVTNHTPQFWRFPTNSLLQQHAWPDNKVNLIGENKSKLFEWSMANWHLMGLNCNFRLKINRQPINVDFLSWPFCPIIIICPKLYNFSYGKKMEIYIDEMARIRADKGFFAQICHFIAQSLRKFKLISNLKRKFHLIGLLIII